VALKPMLTLPEGIKHFPFALDYAAQLSLVEDIRAITATSPLFTPAMPRTGKEMSVRMTNCGTLGWVTDQARGYRYQNTHPITGAPWPTIPQSLLKLWQTYASYPHLPEACLVNFYGAEAKMGLHQDRDESNFEAPVLSISLGDACLFRVGGLKRDDKTVSLRLESGDILILGGESRLAFHGVDKIYPNSSPLLKNGGRINLTLRRVTKASSATLP
jgi:DNA oxidative demethylase